MLISSSRFDIHSKGSWSESARLRRLETPMAGADLIGRNLQLFAPGNQWSFQSLEQQCCAGFSTLKALHRKFKGARRA